MQEERSKRLSEVNDWIGGKIWDCRDKLVIEWREPCRLVW